MRRPRYLLAAPVAALALTGCGESTLDVDEIESQLAPKIEKETGTADVTVTCPDDVEAEEGGEFECALAAAGGIEAKVKVTQKDDEGNVTWRVVQP